MADFCKQCSEYLFGYDTEDLKGFSTYENTENGLFPVVICEGCGIIQIDHEGNCVSKIHAVKDPCCQILRK